MCNLCIMHGPACLLELALVKVGALLVLSSLIALQ